MESKDCAGSYCVDEGDLDLLCTRKTTESTCLANNKAGAKRQCAWLSTIQVNVKSPSCEPNLPEKRCVPMMDTGDTCDKNPKCKNDPRTYAPADSHSGRTILLNTARCGLEPIGWTQCLDGVSSLACDCECKS